jgi:hypothetical protein
MIGSFYMSGNLNLKTFKIKVCHDQPDIHTNMCKKTEVRINLQKLCNPVLMA